MAAISGPAAPSSGLWATVREAVRGTMHDFTAVPIRRAVILLAVPMVLEMSMESLFAVTAACSTLAVAGGILFFVEADGRLCGCEVFPRNRSGTMRVNQVSTMKTF